MRPSYKIFLTATLAVLTVTGGTASFASSTGLETQKAADFGSVGLAKPVAAAPTGAPASAKIQMPPPEALIIMIRQSLVALSQANVTNNYQVLNALGSNNFRQANSPARLAQLFAPFRSNNIDLAPVVFVTPQLSYQPVITEGKLRLVGYFPTQPMRVDFDLQFEPAEGQWKLFGLAVNLKAAAPLAQAQPRPNNTNSPRSR